MKTYSEKLKDPRWQKRRLEILSRDGFACNICGCTKNTLHVHHAFYSKSKDPWDYQDSVLTTLCESCHAQVEDVNRLLAVITPQPFGINACFGFAELYKKRPIETAELIALLDDESVGFLVELLWRQRRMGSKPANQ